MNLRVLTVAVGVAEARRACGREARGRGGMTVPSQHPLFEELTERQRETVNRVWDEIVVAALEEADEKVRALKAQVVEHEGRARAARLDLAGERAAREGLERELWMVRVHGGGS